MVEFLPLNAGKISKYTFFHSGIRVHRLQLDRGIPCDGLGFCGPSLH